MSAAIEEGYIPRNRAILNHDIMNCTADEVVGNYLYSGRALGISEPWDMIQLHPDLRPYWEDIKAHYSRIGLKHSQDIIWDTNLRELGKHIGFHPSVFFFGPHECRFWGDEQWLNVVKFINSKNNFMKLAETLGVDTPLTLCFDNVTRITEADFEKLKFPCYLKAAISVSGVGIYRCKNNQEFIKAINQFDKNVPVQIQEEVITDTFLNMQYQIIDNEVYRLTASEQILKGFVHQGNRVPSSHEPWESVEPMAYWLRDQGMKGIFAFDVAIMQTDQGLRFPAIECNPRFNGATYPTLIAQKLNIPEWSSRTFDTKHSKLSDIDLKDIEYDNSTGEGAIIINWGTIKVGKLMILLAGSSEYQDALAVELSARL